MGIPQIYCSICGAPIFETGTLYNSPQHWLAKSLLLTTAHTTETNEHKLEPDLYYPRPINETTLYSYHLGPEPPDNSTRQVLRATARTGGTSKFTLDETGKEIHVFRVDFTRGRVPSESRGGQLYLPVHEACLEIAERFIEYTADDPSLDGISSIKHLWEVLYRRLDGSPVPSNIGHLPEPHDYYGGRICRGVDWEGGDDPEAAKLLEQYPLEGAQPLTDEIIQKYLGDGDINKEQEDQHPGLRNLKRIWRILSQARVGDIAEIVVTERRDRR